jgi:hypothetical protein
MPYCHTTFQTVAPENVEDLLSTFAKESFVGGQSAYKLDDGSFSVDAGENDIRAIYDKEGAVIRFFCRYKKNLAYYDNKLQSFAAKHGYYSSNQ